MSGFILRRGFLVCVSGLPSHHDARNNNANTYVQLTFSQELLSTFLCLFYREEEDG